MRDIVLNDLRSMDDVARAVFERDFSGALGAFTEVTTTDLWRQFRDTFEDTDERRVAVTAVASTAIGFD